MGLGRNLAACLCVISVAHAEPVDEPSAHHAMPGGMNVATATTLPAGGIAVEVLSSVGYRRGLLAEDHRFARALGELAGAYGVLDALTIAFSLEGYYDRHYGFQSSELSGCGTTCDSGWVGAPHVYARYASRVGGALLGAQLEVWVPGDVAPSLRFDATSIEARGLASLSLGRALVSFNAGFHFDNSANSIDYISTLTVPDRVSFGISNHQAIVAGARVAFPIGRRASLAGETSWVDFVGAAPAGMTELNERSWLLRAGLSGAVRVAASWDVVAFAEGISGPGVLASQASTAQIPILPYEPMIVVGVGITFRSGVAAPAPLAPRTVPCWETPAGCPSEVEPLFGEITGVILDEDGLPLANAKVTVAGKTYGGAASSSTKEDGTYAISNIQVGKKVTTPSKDGKKVEDRFDEIEIAVSVDLDGYAPAAAKIAAPKAIATAVPRIAMVKLLPPGQVRGVVRSLKGKAIAGATVSVSPGEQTSNSGADGSFVIDLAPGAYRVKVSAPGFRDQVLDVTIDPNGVALKEFILRQ